MYQFTYHIDLHTYSVRMNIQHLHEYIAYVCSRVWYNILDGGSTWVSSFFPLSLLTGCVKLQGSWEREDTLEVSWTTWSGRDNITSLISCMAYIRNAYHLSCSCTLLALHLSWPLGVFLEKPRKIASQPLRVWFQVLLTIVHIIQHWYTSVEQIIFSPYTIL